MQYEIETMVPSSNPALLTVDKSLRTGRVTVCTVYCKNLRAGRKNSNYAKIKSTHWITVKLKHVLKLCKA